MDSLPPLVVAKFPARLPSALDSELKETVVEDENNDITKLSRNTSKLLKVKYNSIHICMNFNFILTPYFITIMVGINHNHSGRNITIGT